MRALRPTKQRVVKYQSKLLGSRNPGMAAAKAQSMVMSL
jgi:hypothetical protein